MLVAQVFDVHAHLLNMVSSLISHLSSCMSQNIIFFLEKNIKMRARGRVYDT